MTELVAVDQGGVANPRPVSKIKTGLVSQPITDADDETVRDRSCIATRPRSARCSEYPINFTGLSTVPRGTLQYTEKGLVMMMMIYLYKYSLQFLNTFIYLQV